MLEKQKQENAPRAQDSRSDTIAAAASSAPTIALPKGGGAIRGMGEKFSANPVTGTGTLAVPLAISPTRSGFGPSLSLTYDSGNGNGPFGIGWNLALPSISRKTDKGLPTYRDAAEEDVYLMSGAEDLVPVRNPDGTLFWQDRDGHRVYRYRPRIEGLFARIERWVRLTDGDVHWRSVSPTNITTLYGKSAASRIADPADATHVSAWLICETVDDKGNAVVYEYAGENSDNLDLIQSNEQNRNEDSRKANRYIKRIKYGNRSSRLVQPDLSAMVWLFEVVFDYDELHYEELPQVAGQDDRVRAAIAPAGKWQARPDPFSRYRTCFEVRTYRRCRRAMMFHRFDELGSEPCLVSSTEFDYADFDYAAPVDAAAERGHVGSTRFGSFIRAVKKSGYLQDKAAAPLVQGGATFLTYSRKSMPPLAFEYTQAVVQAQVETVSGESLDNLPAGLDQTNYHWVDLDGEGMSGILAQQAGAWFYKRNLSPLPEAAGGEAKARFAPTELLPQMPAFADLTAGRQFMDLGGDGQTDVVNFDAPVPGYFERSRDAGWDGFRSFSSLPNIDWKDPNLRFVDLTGDGLPDVLITEDDVFVWHASLGELGFSAAEKVHRALDEEDGPRVVFADGMQSIYLADMSGGGLTDIVRVRNGEVCYWPNLGYGRFGARVSMDNAPWPDQPDQFDRRRIRLVDIDGSGTIDMLYIGHDGVRLYFNQSGNRWSDAHALPVFPKVDDLSAVAALDLLGNGTACLVWSSPLPADAAQPMRHVRLMQDKPHLLTRVVNNLGAETRIRYAPSTRFYLEDKAAGRPWITRLPFPVHVVDQVESRDHISRHRFVSRFAYHHGYFDGAEREFRGFAMVEQWDTEAFEDYVVGVAHFEGTQELAPELNQPPVMTRTWFHTGAYFDGHDMLHRMRGEYHLQKQYLPQTVLPNGLEAHELRECVRALKGSMLRQEIYSFDGDANQQHPYAVTENCFEVRLVQNRLQGRHAVFMTVGCESVSLYMERNPADPRITHSLNLEFGPYGNVLKSASVVYGRKTVDATLPAAVTKDQQRLYVTAGEVDFTDDIDQINPTVAYRLRVPYQARSYEITGIAPAGELFGASEIKGLIATAAGIDYEVVADGLNPQKRLLTHSRNLFLDNNLAVMALGQRDTMGLDAVGYQLAFTPGVVAAHYAGKVSDVEFAAAGYVHFNGDANWWTPSSTAIYPADPARHFYIPTAVRDPLGVESTVVFDKYDLLMERVLTKSAIWTEVSAVNDYRILGPVMTTDPNKNRSAVEMDALGMVVKSAVMGKAGSNDGDTLADPTMRMEYEMFNWMKNGKPNFVRSLAREQHGAANPRWRESYGYSNGSGGVALMKGQAHPGKALQVDADGNATEVDADPRWVGDGRTIVNNKGNPVKQYEAYFSTTHEYEDEKALREIGATPVFYYDAIGRNIRTELPNGTFTRSEIHPWLQKVFDTNDTVRDSQWYSERGSPDPAVEAEPLNNPERRAAWLAARHAGTPGIIHLNSLGRPVWAIADYGNGKTAAAGSESDLTGRYTKSFDQLGRLVSSGFICMGGMAVMAESAEKGKRWTFQNVLGAMVKTWDQHGRELRTEYDALHRPLNMFVREAGQAEALVSHMVYGDRHPNAVQLNLLGATHLLFDQGGLVRVPALDFKGNPTRGERILAKDYQNTIDWSAVAAQANYNAIEPTAAIALENGEVFSSSALYDALGRPTQVTLPDGTVMLPSYNEAGFLARLQAKIRGQGAFVDFLKDQDYDANGKRQFAHYGNDLLTRYFYDAKSFQLTRLLTYPSGSNPDTQAVQDLHYTFDAAANITQVSDDAQQTCYFNNAVVKPESLFEYDALYQLVRATGRELAGPTNDLTRRHGDLAALPQLPHANSADAVRAYTEEFEYDLVGNIKLLQHRFKNQGGVGAGWTRRYRYAYEDNAADRTNRLSATSLPGDPDAGPYSATYDHDAYGNMTRMPHLSSLEWNHLDQLRQVELDGGGTAYYVYGTGGQRLRKVIDQNGSTQLDWIFLGAVMIFRRRRRSTGVVELERSTVHISDNTGAIAQVSTKTTDINNSDPANPLGTPLIRYQLGNHLGSATIELDQDGNIISYEEYHPFGTSAYRSSKPGFDLSLKRFRFSGKERDDETGLYYFGARYLAPWLGRWASSDPAGFVKGFNLYKYCSNNPVMFHDPNGMDDIRIVKRGNYTGNESFDDLVKQIPKGYRLKSGVTAENYKSSWDAERKIWLILEEDKGGQGTGAGATSGVGKEVVKTNPEGHIHEIAQNFDDQKKAAYQERIENDRAIATRSKDPGSTSRTKQLRSDNKGLRDDYEAGLPGGKRPAGTDIDHTVELQDISRNNNVVRPQDHRTQNSRLNSSQGSSQQKVNQRRLRQGVPEDVPAGAVARGTEMGNPRIQPGYRGVMRGAGYGLMVLGPILTAWGASNVQNDAVRYIGYGLAGGEGLGAGAYFVGRFSMGGGAAGNAAGLRVMGLGGGLMRVAGGTAGIVLGTYGLITDYQSGNYGVMLGDASSIVAGGAILAGSAPVAAIATGVGVSNMAGDWVESKVTPEYGRTAGVGAGTLAGAGTGALVGAAVGVWFFGVGAPVGAVVGGVIGGVAGFVGAYW